MSWETERLTEFVVALGEARDERSAAERGVERVAEALEAEVAALVRGGAVVASTGWPRIEVPERELVAVGEARHGKLPIPGAGERYAVAVDLGGSQGGTLLVSRADEPLDAAELTLLRGMARSLALSLELLGAVSAERTLRVRSEQQALENARLLKSVRERQRLLEGLAAIQRSISHRAPLQDVLAAVVQQAGDLLRDPAASLLLRDTEQRGRLRYVATVGDAPAVAKAGRTRGLGDGVAGRAAAEGRMIVIEDYPAWPDAMPHFVDHGVHAAMAAPVHEQGEVVGALVVSSREPGRTFSRAEQDILQTLAEHASLALTDAKTVGAMVHQALHDALTGLPNRALFLDRLSHALSRRGGTGEVSVLFCDLDRFKTVNDSLGHEAGDQLLVAVAERIGGCLRSGDTAARLGGDEFAILLEDVSDAGEAVAVAERLTESLRVPFTLAGREVFVSCSIGIASGHAAGEELLRNADVAMYRAKAEGAARFAVFEPSMRAEVLERLELEADLRRAEQRGELEVHYQPLIELDGGALAGFEALVRWRHPERGLVPPLAFIPLAEESELINALGRWVLEEACRRAAAWDREFPVAPGRRQRAITVNLSGRQLEQPDLVDQVGAALDASGLAPERLVLEITETVLMHDTEATIARLAALKAIGVRLAVDDFGTGYSSLRYLGRFPIDLLKMAKPFVDNVDSGVQGAALARTIVDLGTSLGLEIVAEGIELGTQFAHLRRLGCHLGQGYLFARPLTVGQVTQMLADPRTAEGWNAARLVSALPG
ncbi:MAG TPA: EAL domain-containing protein [Capillimicrobium sp.]|nr:EAL domain-containing protein [Capillimicrobium sp.]